jgi:hypothetical protein
LVDNIGATTLQPLDSQIALFFYSTSAFSIRYQSSVLEIYQADTKKDSLLKAVFISFTETTRL